MSRTIRVGVVGTSWYAGAMHLPNIQSHPQATVAAVCGRSTERAAELARQFGGAQVFTDYRAMIAAGGLDALVVAVPDELHYPVTLAALDAGLHVLCEKPLALTVEQAREMLARAEAAGVVHMVSFTYRWTPHFRHLRSLAARGVIGELYHASLSCISPVGRGAEYAWRFDGSRANGALGDLGPHIIDTARGLCGEIVSVSAQLGSHVEHAGAQPVNDTAMLAVEFADGAQGVIQISAVAHTGARGQEQRVALYGSQGTLEADSTFEQEEVRLLMAGEQHFTPLPVPDEVWGDADRADFFDLFRRQPVGARLFVDAILGAASDIPTFDDGLQVQLVIDAALRSHRESRRVPVER